MPCSVLVALPQPLPQPCHQHILARGKKRVTMHPAGLWLGHHTSGEVLLLGHPAANGPKEATGELLVPGRAEGAGGALQVDVPAQVAAELRAGTGPALALAQP